MCANRISPSMCAAQATEALKITAKHLVGFEVMDEIIPEPPGGAHADPMAAFPAIKDAINRNWAQCVSLPDLPLCCQQLHRFALFFGPSFQSEGQVNVLSPASCMRWPR